MSAPEDRLPIPEHVKLAVLEAMQTNDFDRLRLLPGEDQDAVQRYITSLLACAILYGKDS